MNKLMAALLAVTLVCATGCCTRTASDGTVTRNPLNCARMILPVVDDTICPNLETGKEALRASAFLWPLVSFDPDIYAIWLVFDNFSKGVCYAAHQLRWVLAAYEDIQVPTKDAFGVMAAKPSVDALKKVVSQ